MKKIGWTHPLITAIVQVSVGLLFQNWWIGGALAVAWFCSREQTQAEYRAIELAGGKRADFKWYQAYSPRIWTWHSVTDFVLPILVAICIFSI